MNVENKGSNWFKLIMDFLFLTLSFPVFILGFILNFFPFFIPVFVRKYIFKSQYEGFFSSLQFGLGIISFPLFCAIQTVVFELFTGRSVWIALLFFVAQYPLGKFALSWNKLIKNWFGSIRYLNLKNKKTIRLTEFEALYNQIVETVLSVK